MQKITGYSKKNKFDGSSSGSDFADELNTFMQGLMSMILR
jgi:hypothetical protein